MNGMTFNDKLKQLRTEYNLTQEDIAKILKIERGTYSQYELEYITIPIKHLNSISSYFNVSIDYLLDLSTINNYENESKDINLKLSSQRLKEFRKDNKLTQKKLANILNTDNSTISKYEQERNPIATPFLYTICKKYHISADYLLGKIDEPKYL